ncbi:MAG: serine dehydratase beta chain [archaeon]|nr:serine dehydratase beta chain [archaeon]
METPSVFDIIGPVMVGPSSSHTAGALKIGLSLHRKLDSRPKRCRIVFYNSFADTMDGHCTKKAVVAGVLGFDTGSPHVRDSLVVAKKRGVLLEFEKKYDESLHPNSVLIEIHTINGNFFACFGESIGGGSIIFRQLETEVVKSAGTHTKSPQ